MFDIITITCGRNLYLNRLIRSIAEQDVELINNHYIIFQDNSFDISVFQGISAMYMSRISHKIIPQKLSVGEVLNNETRYFKSPYTLKLDDDAVIRSPDFFKHAQEVINLNNEPVFSPFPVGLINNLGGPSSIGRQVKHSRDLDTYYTQRKVSQVGGFARFSPTKLLQSAKFTDSHNEDQEFSEFCRQKNIEMFYLENTLIVEHQESTLGQHERYGENYFKGRF